ncbi:MAG: 50S ribosomal protein L32 [Betaproteobacteria bacterium]
MANPKNRHSKTRKRLRRTHWKLVLPNMSTCPQCHEPKLPHRICAHCGFYGGRKIIDVKAAE